MLHTVKVLGITSEIHIQKLIQFGLKGYGYHILMAETPEEGFMLTAQKMPNIILLILNQKAGNNGLEVCFQLREWCTTPIIALSTLNDKETKLVSLEAGADDFMLIPFDMEELEARIRTILRRITLEQTGLPLPQIRAGSLVIDLSKRRVLLDQKNIHLTPREYKLLCLLAVNAGKVVTSEILLDKTYTAQQPRSIHALQVYINTLRKKLGEDADTAHFIITEPRIGYRFIDV